jgi:hypothetical protein
MPSIVHAPSYWTAEERWLERRRAHAAIVGVASMPRRWLDRDAWIAVASGPAPAPDRDVALRAIAQRVLARSDGGFRRVTCHGTARWIEEHYKRPGRFAAMAREQREGKALASERPYKDFGKAFTPARPRPCATSAYLDSFRPDRERERTERSIGATLRVPTLEEARAAREAFADVMSTLAPVATH